MTNDDQILLRPIEAARLLAISRSQLYKLVAEGKIPAVRLGEKTTRFLREDLVAWARSLREPPAEQREATLASTKGPIVDWDRGEIE